MYNICVVYICSVYRLPDQCLLPVRRAPHLRGVNGSILFSFLPFHLSVMSRNSGPLQEVVSLILCKPETTKLACDGESF